MGGVFARYIIVLPRARVSRDFSYIIYKGIFQRDDDARHLRRGEKF